MMDQSKIIIIFLTVIFILLSLALIADESNSSQVVGRMITPLEVTITPTQQNCKDLLWGKQIYRRCD